MTEQNWVWFRVKTIMTECFEDSGFSLWLKTFCDTFSTLPDAQKNSTIEGIIDSCGPEQLRFLSTKLETLVKRDYLKCLPLELSFHVLKWLDPVSLCKCCLVSKKWNKVILSCEDIWQNACKQLGMQAKEDNVDSNSERNSTTTWKQVYISHFQNMKKLKDESAVVKKRLCGHTARVFALYYRGNYLATGSDDRSVRLWDLKSRQCKYVLKAHTCADVRFDDDKAITASFDNTVGMWDWKTGEMLQCFRGHTAAVFSVDYSDELDTVVSGSADCTLRIWRMSSGQCLQTRYGHSDWVIKVILIRSEVDSHTHRKNQYVVLSMDKRNIKIWSLDRNCNKCLATLSPGADSSVNLQPRLQCDGKKIVCASERAILLWDFKTLQMTRIFTTSPANWLVAYGHVYSLLMDMNFLYIVCTKSEEIVAEYPLPAFRRSLRGSNFTPGETFWLDGLVTRPQGGLLFASGMPDYSVSLLMLKDGT